MYRQSRKKGIQARGKDFLVSPALIFARNINSLYRVVSKLLAVQHFLLDRATVSVTGRVVRKSYNYVPVAWDKT